MREQAGDSFLVPMSTFLWRTTFHCGSKETFIPVPSYRQVEFYLLRSNCADLGFGQELSLLPHGKVSKCYIYNYALPNLCNESWTHMVMCLFVIFYHDCSSLSC